jgi:hypothetical protein
MAAPGGAGGGAHQSALDLELRCTIFSAVSTYTILRSSRTYQGGLGGGSGDHNGAPWPAADGRPRHMVVTVLIALVQEKRKEVASSS